MYSLNNGYAYPRQDCGVFTSTCLGGTTFGLGSLSIGQAKSAEDALQPFELLLVRGEVIVWLAVNLSGFSGAALVPWPWARRRDWLDAVTGTELTLPFASFIKAATFSCRCLGRQHLDSSLLCLAPSLLGLCVTDLELFPRFFA